LVAAEAPVTMKLLELVGIFEGTADKFWNTTLTRILIPNTRVVKLLSCLGEYPLWHKSPKGRAVYFCQRASRWVRPKRDGVGVEGTQNIWRGLKYRRHKLTKRGWTKIEMNNKRGRKQERRNNIFDTDGVSSVQNKLKWVLSALGARGTVLGWGAMLQAGR
jgi:hypothetical protein